MCGSLRPRIYVLMKNCHSLPIIFSSIMAPCRDKYRRVKHSTSQWLVLSQLYLWKTRQGMHWDDQLAWLSRWSLRLRHQPPRGFTFPLKVQLRHTTNQMCSAIWRQLWDSETTDDTTKRLRYMLRAWLGRRQLCQQASNVLVFLGLYSINLRKEYQYRVAALFICAYIAFKSNYLSLVSLEPAK